MLRFTRFTNQFQRAALLACLLFPIVLLAPHVASAQMAGSRGGIHGAPANQELAVLSREVAESLIMIEGSAELRVKPTEMRIVLAVTSEAEGSAECSQAVKQTVNKLTQGWKAIGIDDGSVNEDFIAILPRYDWKIEQRGGEDVGVEYKSGYQMQTNVHIAVPDQATAMQVLEKAFDAGVTDIIAFDYWSAELEASKVAARKKAIEAARAKADSMLELFFDEKPKIVNVQEQTRIQFPATMYESFENSFDSSAIRPNRRDIPFITAHRPKNTYYRGPSPDVDAMSQELAMKPEISIFSTVRIYYRSPAAELNAEVLKNKQANEKR